MIEAVYRVMVMIVLVSDILQLSAFLCVSMPSGYTRALCYHVVSRLPANLPDSPSIVQESRYYSVHLIGSTDTNHQVQDKVCR
jgi:hypothetical protein